VPLTNYTVQGAVQLVTEGGVPAQVKRISNSVFFIFHTFLSAFRIEGTPDSTFEIQDLYTLQIISEFGPLLEKNHT